LSLREMYDDAERSRIDDYRRQAAAASSTVGDAMKQNVPGASYRNRSYDEG